MKKIVLILSLFWYSSAIASDSLPVTPLVLQQTFECELPAAKRIMSGTKKIHPIKRIKKEVTCRQLKGVRITRKNIDSVLRTMQGNETIFFIIFTVLHGKIVAA